MEWRNDIGINDLQEGDIIETPSKFPSDHSLFPDICVPIIKHYGISVVVDGKLMIAHNTNENHASIESIEKVFKNRNIGRVMRTGASSDEILKRFNECKNRKYDLSAWNCEDAIRIWSGYDFGFDQRNGCGILTAVVIVIILVTLVSK